MRDSVTIDPRFCGPPDSGNGGYCCGVVAGYLDGAAEVTLHRPPPLARPLDIIVAQTVRLLDRDQLVAEGHAAQLDMDVPAPPSVDQAQRWSRGYAGFRRHAFPGCFVCGPQRAVREGLRIFAGPSPRGDCVAAPWRPDGSLADAGGRVLPAFIWAALDCPGYFALAERRLAVLGRMTAAIDARPPATATCVVVGWPISRDGRKLRAGTALFDAAGRQLARSEQTWIVIDTAAGLAAQGESAPEEDSTPGAPASR